jgi:hypothetical protein
MTNKMHALITGIACCFAAIALAVSLTHTGPRGERGPKDVTGSTGRSATIAHLGICELDSYQWMTNLSNYVPGQAASDPPLITAPVLTDGVPSCPTGNFVSIVPGG